MTRQTSIRPETGIRPALRQMETYWTELRGFHRLPQRRDVDPARIDLVLPHAFLMQRVAPGVGRVRVAGRALTGLLGMDPRGMPLTAFFGVEAREVVTEELTAMFDEPAIVEIPVHARRGLARPKLSGRLMMLPLIGDDGLVSAALGALMVEGAVGSTPRRLDIAPGLIRREPVPRGGQAATVTFNAAGDVPARVERRRGFLRLVVDNG
ncbi:PAS domain-containing protein [Pelagovum pacificum]|nr:PAS domain-containing protein [Pelagovum pacificum]QQA44756.1 PAS domain-containing protein [Pelagovum pacificum]